MLASSFLLTALIATILILRGVPGVKEQTSIRVKILGLAFFGFMAFAGVTKGYEALTSGVTSVANRSGSGWIASSDEWGFWVQIVMCWGASVLGACGSFICLMAPRSRGA